MSLRGQQEKKDPFAGMKACVNYQQEIERLKQLVKTPPSPPPPTTTASEATTPDDTTTTAGPVVTEQEKIRFLAFVCSWTTGGPTSQFLETTNSLWAIPSPWQYCHSSVQNQPLYHSHPSEQHTHRHGPIGTGRRKHY